MYKKIFNNGIDEVVDAIVELLSSTSIKFTIQEDCPVLNPAFFLTLVRNAE